MKDGEKYKRIIVYTLLFITVIFLLNTSVKQSGDFDSYLRASKRMIEGKPVYVREIYPYLYLPLPAFLLIPFTFLSTAAARILWCVINIFLIYSTAGLLLKMVDKKGINTLTLCFFSILFTLRFFIVSSHRGQVNVLNLFLCVLTLHFFLKGKKFYAGLALAAAVVIKITPLLILFYFIYKREFKLSAYVVPGIIIFLLLPSFILGFNGNVEAVMQYKDIVQGIKDHDKLNQSLHNAILHLFSPVSLKDNTNINIMRLAGVQIKYITYILLGIFAIFFVYFFRSRVGREDMTVPLEYSMVIIFILLFSPVSRTDYFVGLFIPHFFYIYYLLKYKSFAHRKKCLWILFISFAFNTLTVDGLVGGYLSDVLESCFCITFGTLMLLGGLAVMKLATKARRHEG